MIMDSFDQKNKSILFLLNDNDPLLMRVIRNKFKNDAGWESVIATSYADAIRLYEQERPHGVITEILINDDSGKTGFDLIQEIRGGKNSAIPIIVFTELRQEEDREKAERLGATSYFIKTQIALSELIEKIKEIV